MQRGFSLVELSIVLVILGLLTGGILGGQALIRAAELRAVSTEYGRYSTAAHSFRDKYFATPGDFSGATRFWTRQVAAAHCVTNSGAAAGSPGACDGNGDGIPGTTAGAVSESGEVFQFWRHLANAGLVEGSYSGLAGAGGIWQHVIGTNAPRSKLGNAGWSMGTIVGYYAGDTSAFAGDYGNLFMFGAANTTVQTNGAVLKPEETWNIDTKMDDGKPGTGKVIARYWDDCTTASSETDTSAAAYALSSTAASCSLMFSKAF